MAAEPPASAPSSAPAPAARPEPRPPGGSWPRLYLIVLGALAAEIALLRLLSVSFP